jgi:Rrf2 family protein
MISQTAEYALRAVVCLGNTNGPPLTTQQIAETSHVPAGYLCKVLQLLGRSGLVQSQRGLHGGYLLAKDPADVSMLDVINAVDPIKRNNGCPLGIPGHNPIPCILHEKLGDAVDTVEKVFTEYTIAKLLAELGAKRPLGLPVEDKASV